MRRKPKLPKNVVSQHGRLYFNKVYRGTRYTAAFNLLDTPLNRKTAKIKARQIADAMRLGEFNPNNFPILSKYHRSDEPEEPSLPLFRDYVDTWLDRKRLLAPATFRTYRNLINKHLLPYFGEVRVNEISKPIVETWLIRAAEEMTSREYANEALRRLKAVIREAADDFEFDTRIDKVKTLRSYEPLDPNKDRLFSLEEASRLYYVMSPRLRTMMLVSMLGGLRTSEMIALKREDVDFDRNLLFVRASMSEGKRKSVKRTASYRHIKMHPVLRRHLAEILAGHDHEYVFVSRRNKPFRHRQNFDNEYRRAKDKANVPDLRWYTFRKMYISMRYASTDAVPAAISREFGHKNVALGLNLYSEAMDHLGCKFEDVAFPLPPTFLSKVG